MTFINKKNHLGVPLRVGLSALVPPKYGGTPLQSLTHRSSKGIASFCITKIWNSRPKAQDVVLFSITKYLCISLIINI